MLKPSQNIVTADPSALFDISHLGIASDVMLVAAGRLQLFATLSSAALSFEELRRRLRLAARPMTVLVTALRAMGLVVVDAQERLALSGIARQHLVENSQGDLTAYFRLMEGKRAQASELLDRLASNTPSGVFAGEDSPVFVFREGVRSATENAASARRTTLALAAHARVVAPVFAEKVELNGCKCVLDVGGGAGIYSIMLLRRFPRLRAIVLDRPEVIKVAKEMPDAQSVLDRVEYVAADMFRDTLPKQCDVVLLSNVAHDWDVPDCEALIERCSRALPSHGQLLIHDYFLNDSFDGPLPIALHSVFLFCVTFGRAYGAREYRSWCSNVGLEPGNPASTLMHLKVLSATKSA